MGISELHVDMPSVLERARSVVLNDPACNLPPFYRAMIYSLFGPPKEESTRVKLGKLAIMTAEKVLPIWQQELPTDLWLRQIINTAKDLLDDIIPLESAYHTAQVTRTRLEVWLPTLYESGTEEISLRTQHVAIAAVECLAEAAGIFSLTIEHVKPEYTEADLDATSTDTASWAAEAYAGPWGDPSSEREKRREFWEWWLLEAVPQAWSSM